MSFPRAEFNQQKLNKVSDRLDELSSEEAFFGSNFISTYFFPVRQKILIEGGKTPEEKIALLATLIPLGETVLHLANLVDIDKGLDLNKRLSEKLCYVYTLHPDGLVSFENLMNWFNILTYEFDAELKHEQAQEAQLNDVDINFLPFASEFNGAIHNADIDRQLSKLAILSLPAEKKNFILEQKNKLMASSLYDILEKTSELIFLVNFGELLALFYQRPIYESIANKFYDDFCLISSPNDNDYAETIGLKIHDLIKRYKKIYAVQLASIEAHQHLKANNPPKPISASSQTAAEIEAQNSQIEKETLDVQTEIARQFIEEEIPGTIELFKKNILRYVNDKKHNILANDADSENIFNSRAQDSDGLKYYLENFIVRYFSKQGATAIFISMLVYLDLFLIKNKVELTQFNSQRLVFTSVAVAHFYIDDVSYGENHLIKIGFVTKSEYKKMITTFFIGIDFDAVISLKLVEAYKALINFKGDDAEFSALKERLNAIVIEELAIRQLHESNQMIFEAERAFKKVKEDSAENLLASIAGITAQFDAWSAKAAAIKNLESQQQFHAELKSLVSDLKSFNKLAQETLVFIEEFLPHGEIIKKISVGVNSAVEQGYDMLAKEITTETIKQAYMQLDNVLHTSVSRLNQKLVPSLFGSAKTNDIRTKLNELLAENTEFKNTMLSHSVSSSSKMEKPK